MKENSIDRNYTIKNVFQQAHMQFVLSDNFLLYAKRDPQKLLFRKII